jgi:cytochrome c553
MMKIKRFAFTSETFRMIFSQGLKHWEVSRNAIPKDAELVRIFDDHGASSIGTIYLDYYSESFPDLPEGSFLETNHITITAHNGKLVYQDNSSNSKIWVCAKCHGKIYPEPEIFTIPNISDEPCHYCRGERGEFYIDNIF